MSYLHGIVIADPAKSNLRFSRVEHDHYETTRKYPGKPQGQFVSEQDKLNNFDRKMPSIKGYETIKERTIPIDNEINNEMIDLWRQRRENLRADVEKPLLEADKNISGGSVDVHEDLNLTESTGVNFGDHYNPNGNYPQTTFKQDLRINMRYIRPESLKLSNSQEYLEKVHYLYNKNYGSFQNIYYNNNPWKDSHGKICLFERQFTRIFA